MLTVRHPLPALGPVESYAGAGVNRSVFFCGIESEPTVLSNHNRRRTLGAAAELGAELRLNERLMIRADLRWVDLAAEATMLRADSGLVGADPVSFGVRWAGVFLEAAAAGCGQLRDRSRRVGPVESRHSKPSRSPHLMQGRSRRA